MIPNKHTPSITRADVENDDLSGLAVFLERMASCMKISRCIDENDVEECDASLLERIKKMERLTMRERIEKSLLTNKNNNMQKQERVGLLYVCGFMFSPNKDQVLLINKTHPDWQNEKLNGLGGKVHHEETAYGAMQRTFEAQTGVKTDDVQWRDFSTYSWKGQEENGLLIFFETTALDMQQFSDCRNTTDEILAVLPVVHLPIMDNTLPDIKWLIPLALDVTRRLTMSFDGQLMSEDKDFKNIVREVWYDPAIEMSEGVEENTAGEQKKSGQDGEKEGEGLKEKMEFTVSKQNEAGSELQPQQAMQTPNPMVNTSAQTESIQENVSEQTTTETKAAGTGSHADEEVANAEIIK